MFDGVPGEFAGFLTEPAFTTDETTFCHWRRTSDPAWRTGAVARPEGDDPDGSAELLRLLDGDPDAYRAWAEGYFETPVARSAVRHVFDHRPLTQGVVYALNPRLSPADLAEDASEIDYPMSG